MTDTLTPTRPADSAQAPSPVASLDTLLARLPALAAALGEGAAARELARDLPFAAFALFKRSGLGTLRIPRHLGGPGGSVQDLVHVVATLAAADSNVAHALRLHYNITESIALSPPTPFLAKQAERVLGGALFGGASTELGTPRTGMFTSELTPHGAGYRVSGKKFYATGTAFCDYASINVLNPEGVSVTVVVPTDRPGIRLLDDWDGMGQRMTASGSLLMDEVEVAADEIAVRGNESLVGRHGSALRQLHLVTVAAGIVRTVLTEATGYVKTRGRPTAHSPAETASGDLFIQQVIGEVAAASHAIDALVAQNAAVLDRSAAAIAAQAPDADAQVIASTLATAKTQFVVARLALSAAEHMYEAGGASATSRALNFDRHWRNLRTIFSHNPLLHKARVVGDFHLNGTTTHLREGKFF